MLHSSRRLRSLYTTRFEKLPKPAICTQWASRGQFEVMGVKSKHIVFPNYKYCISETISDLHGKCARLYRHIFSPASAATSGHDLKPASKSGQTLTKLRVMKHLQCISATPNDLQACVATKQSIAETHFALMSSQCQARASMHRICRERANEGTTRLPRFWGYQKH